MGRSDTGITFTTYLPYVAGARCAEPDVDPNMWSATDDATIALARHICVQHCPVLAACNKVANQMPPELRIGVVLGGLAYTGLRPGRRPPGGARSAYQPIARRCDLCGDTPMRPPTREGET